MWDFVNGVNKIFGPLLIKRKITMNRMIIYIILIFTVSLFAQNSDENLELKIGLDKSEFLEGESIWVKISLKNLGDDAKQVTKMSFPLVIYNKSFDFNLIDSEGLRVKDSGIRSDGLHTVTLNPNDSTYDYYDILNFYGEPIHKLLRTGRKYLKPGSYKLSAKLSTPNISLPSNEIKFEVVEPNADEVESYELFKEAYKTWLIKNKREEEARDLFRTAIDTYPNSIYTDLHYSYLYKINSIGLRDYRACIDVIKEMIQRNPKSHVSEKFVKSLVFSYQQLNEDDIIINELNELNNQYGDINPELKRVISKKIESLQK